MKLTGSILATSIFALAATVSAGLVPRTSGPATFFIPGGATGACGGAIQNSDFAVALSSANYAGGAHCGQDVTVQFNGKSIVVRVADLCPGCASNGIDLTEGAFAALADVNLGVIEVNWNFD
ncbi:RlpA-like double-psi beta-barrel-protein domain-containing protein-containing protein [Mycena pura]|uniref:RlpA-like double-psi beta-barrel-protein domain-containing protein-containing protein n=1 Tax=Mycena pura TaxID=153505 RepID=A0AAD6Y4S7_9AGAR|nr:RlpA-like double-psi beta-barrel-protein domain-containing protein-containing protein [Mycena pura]